MEFILILYTYKNDILFSNYYKYIYMIYVNKILASFS
jgi:hypothetical protein